MIREALVRAGAEGLCNSDRDCGCRLDDLAPCGEMREDCEAARVGDPSEDDDEDDVDFFMEPIAPRQP